MAQKVIRLTEGDLRQIIHNVLNEAAASFNNGDEFTHYSIQHTNNAFKVGETIILYFQGTVKNGEQSRVMWQELPAKIEHVDDENIYFTILKTGKKGKLNKQSKTHIRCSIPWDKAYTLLCNGKKGSFPPGQVKVDYETVNGEEFLMLYYKPSTMGNWKKIGFKYDELMSSDNPKRYSFEVESEEDKTGLYLLPGKVKPDKFKAQPPENAVAVKKEWVQTKPNGNIIKGSPFLGWKFEFADDIIGLCPWMKTPKATWFKDGKIIPPKEREQIFGN